MNNTLMVLFITFILRYCFVNSRLQIGYEKLMVANKISMALILLNTNETFCTVC